MWCGHDIFDVEHRGLPAKLGSIDGIAVPKEESRGSFNSADLQKLASSPHGCRVRCDVEIQNPSPVVAQDDQHKQDPESGRRYSEEIKRNEISGMIFEKRPPGLTRRPRVPDHILGDCGLGDLDP